MDERTDTHIKVNRYRDSRSVSVEIRFLYADLSSDDTVYSIDISNLMHLKNPRHKTAYYDRSSDEGQANAVVGDGNQMRIELMMQTGSRDSRRRSWSSSSSSSAAAAEASEAAEDPKGLV